MNMNKSILLHIRKTMNVNNHTMNNKINHEYE